MRLASRIRAALLVVVLAAACAALPAVRSDAADPGALRDRAAAARDRERSLAASLAQLGATDRRLSRQIAALERRQAAIQADLARDEVRLATLRTALRAERARAQRLARRLDQARALLRERLVARYEAPDVDALAVVLNSSDFGDLVDRASFLRRIQENDQEIVVTVRTARADAVRERERLDRAEGRQRLIVIGLRARRDAIAGMAAGVAARRSALQRIRAVRAAALQRTRHTRRRLERDVRAAEAAVARAASAGAPPAVDVRGGWAIPWEIVQCESGGQNLPPNSAGASGYYQIMPETWKGLGGSGPAAYLRPKGEQDAAAAKLWAGGAGASNWVCAGLVGITG